MWLAGIVVFLTGVLLGALGTAACTAVCILPRRCKVRHDWQPSLPAEPQHLPSKGITKRYFRHAKIAKSQCARCGETWWRVVPHYIAAPHKA